MAEQIAGGVGPDVLTLRHPYEDGVGSGAEAGEGGLALATAPPKVRFHVRPEADRYAAKAKSVVVRHRSKHNVIAMIEIVSPGNKSSRRGLDDFVKKAEEVLRTGVHLLIVDLFPPGRFDPLGIPRMLLDRREEPEDDGQLDWPADMPLALGSFVGGPSHEAFLQPAAVGMTLVDMPLVLSTERYVPVPLESTYQSAWEAVPAVWRDVVSGKADRA
jgi:hypothetical protein